MTKRLQESDDNLSSQSKTLEKQSQASFDSMMERIDSKFQKLCELIEARFGNPNVEISVFTGSDLRPWLDSLENRFKIEEFTDMQKMAMAHGFLGGEAESWYNKRVSWLPFLNWEDLKGDLLLQFGDYDDPERIELRLKIQKWLNEQITIPQATSDSFVNIESNDLEVETESDSVPVIDTCLTLVPESTEAEKSFSHSDVLQEISVLSGDLLVDAESDAETEELHEVKPFGTEASPTQMELIQHQISTQTEAISGHIQVPDLILEPSLPFHTKSIAVWDDYYSGFSLSDLCDRAALSQKQIVVLLVGNLAVNVEKISFMNIFGAYQMFDIMLLEVSSGKHMSMQRKIPKSWKFKYKLKQARGIRVAGCLCFMDIRAGTTVWWNKRRRKKRNVGQLNWKELLVRYKKHFKDKIIREVKIQYPCDLHVYKAEKLLLISVSSEQEAWTWYDKEVTRAVVADWHYLKWKFMVQVSKVKSHSFPQLVKQSKVTKKASWMKTELMQEKAYQILDNIISETTCMRIKKKWRKRFEFTNTNLLRNRLRKKIQNRTLWAIISLLQQHGRKKVLKFRQQAKDVFLSSLCVIVAMEVMIVAVEFEMHHMTLCQSDVGEGEVAAESVAYSVNAYVPRMLQSFHISAIISHHKENLRTKQQKKQLPEQCQSLFSAAMLGSITCKRCVSTTAHIDQEKEKFSAIWWFKFQQRPCVQEKLDNLLFSFLLLHAPTVERRIYFSVWPCWKQKNLQHNDLLEESGLNHQKCAARLSKNMELETIIQSLCKGLNLFWLTNLMPLPFRIQVKAAFRIERVGLLPKRVCVDCYMETEKAEYLRLLKFGKSLQWMLTMRATLISSHTLWIHIQIYQPSVPQYNHKLLLRESNGPPNRARSSHSWMQNLTQVNAVLKSLGDIKAPSIQLEGKLGLRTGGIDTIRACSRLLQRKMMSWHLQNKMKR